MGFSRMGHIESASLATRRLQRKQLTKEGIKQMRNKLIVTEQWLITQNACAAGRSWFVNQKAKSLRVLISKLITQSKFDWANWVIVRFMTHKQNVQYACLSALGSLKNFESIYPNDKRPREAIQAALKWALNPTEENKSAAAEAAESAAWAAAWAARSAAEAARSAAWAAAWAAESAAEAARSAAWAAAEAARSAAESAAWKKILTYGLKIVFNESIKHLIKKGLK